MKRSTITTSYAAFSPAMRGQWCVIPDAGIAPRPIKSVDAANVVTLRGGPDWYWRVEYWAHRVRTRIRNWARDVYLNSRFRGAEGK